jgi:hypothetical protein
MSRTIIALLHVERGATTPASITEWVSTQYDGRTTWREGGRMIPVAKTCRPPWGTAA